jgi:hypothetical protein
MSGIFASGAMLSQGVRSKQDSLNWGFGGACVGLFLGLRAKKVHSVVMNMITLGAIGTACDYGCRSFDQEHMKHFLMLKDRNWAAFADKQEK